ncbi:hypothetical protein HUU05_08690 [candidate division KSB1 bacterium]|nr:hypothetical protein [candidate division KSB1 bacterium]
MKPYGPEFKPRAVRPKAPRPKYQWPANKISADDMALLYHLRARTGTPINKLLQEAIRKLGEATQSQSATESAESAEDTPTATE